MVHGYDNHKLTLVGQGDQLVKHGDNKCILSFRTILTKNAPTDIRRHTQVSGRVLPRIYEHLDKVSSPKRMSLLDVYAPLGYGALLMMAEFDTWPLTAPSWTSVSCYLYLSTHIVGTCSSNLP